MTVSSLWVPSPGRMRSRRVVYLVDAATDFGVLQVFSRDQAAAISASGSPATVTDISTDEGLASLLELLTFEQPRAVIGFAGVGADLQVDDTLLYELAEVPYIGLMTDSPVYRPLRHRVASPWQALLFPDADFLDVSLSLSPPHALRGLYRYGMPAPAAAPMPLDQRPHGIVYCKSGAQQVAIREGWNALPRVIRAVLEDVVAVALTSSRTPLWQLVSERVAADGLVSGLEHTLAFCFMVHSLDAYIRAARATMLCEALLPFPEAVVIGGQWGHVDTRRARARFLPDVPHRELLPFFDQARVVANVQPLMRHSPQERIIYGMQRGAVVLTDAEDPLAEALGRDRFCALRWDEPLGDAIADALREPSRRQATVTAAAAFARSDYSAMRSASSVLKAIEWMEATNATSFAG